MASTLLAALAALTIWYCGRVFYHFKRNIRLAEQSGFKYVVTPIHAYNIPWMLTHNFWRNLIMKYVPETWWKDWLLFTDADWVYNNLNAPFENLSTSAIMLVSSRPSGNVLFVNDASLIHHVTSSREKFPKKTSDYVVLNAFGRNIVTTEGAEWRRHRKAMAPGFNEGNNRLVFEETIMQCQGMIDHWMIGSTKAADGSYLSSKTIESLPDDTMRITLYIITAVGFGVRLLWPGVKVKGEKDDSGLITYPDVPENGHTMTFQASIKEVLEEIFLILLFPMWVLKWGTKRMRRAREAYINWKCYTEELLAIKIAQSRAGEKVEGMDLMRLMVDNSPELAQQLSSPSKLESGAVAEKGREKRGTEPNLTKQEILGDTFITVLAGHETTANTIHFMLVHLALTPSAQCHLQADIDSTFNSTPQNPTPTSEWDYDSCITTLLGNMAGATFNEMLRLMPPVYLVPKVTADGHDQIVRVDGEKRVIPAGTRININNIGTGRSAKYFTSMGPSKISSKDHDLDDFVPERWLKGGNGKSGEAIATDRKGKEEKSAVDREFGGFTGTDISDKLFKPISGSYTPFSDGQRSCLGRRLAQVEMVTVLSIIFQKYSIELAVDHWASDKEVEAMSDEEKKALYQKAMDRARATIKTATVVLTLKLHGARGGDKFIPVRVVKRGEERFIHLFQ